jgi:hypothetical protein
MLWSTGFLGKPVDHQQVMKFPEFYGTWWFFTDFTRACQLALYKLIQSAPSHYIYLRSVLIFS